MSTKQKYAEMKQQIKDTRAAMVATAKTMFTETSKEVFEKFPTLESFGWTQYTPYFNDGETCTFQANTYYPSMSFLTDGVEEKFGSNTGEDEPDEPKTTEALREKAEKAITTFLGIFEDDDLEAMFGDHQQVTVCRDGTVDTEDYDHD